MEVWTDKQYSCFIRHGTKNWSIYTEIEYDKLKLCVTVPDNISEKYTEYKEKIVEYLKANTIDVIYWNILPGDDFGTVFEANVPCHNNTERKRETEVIDVAVVDIMKPLWEEYAERENTTWNMEMKQIVYSQPNMEDLRYGRF